MKESIMCAGIPRTIKMNRDSQDGQVQERHLEHSVDPCLFSEESLMSIRAPRTMKTWERLPPGRLNAGQRTVDGRVAGLETGAPRDFQGNRP
jgi:hypothetical protein